MCDTGGTLVKAAEEIKNAGALEVRAIATHGVLSGPALERLYNAKISGHLIDFVCSDSLPIDVHEQDNVTQISTAKQIAKGIIAINAHKSVEELKETV